MVGFDEQSSKLNTLLNWSFKMNDLDFGSDYAALFHKKFAVPVVSHLFILYMYILGILFLLTRSLTYSLHTLRQSFSSSCFSRL